jgi:hypothetical protein
MTTAELKRRLLRVVGIENPGSAPDFLVDAVVNAVNHAFQVLWSDVPRDRRSHYTRREDTVTLSAGSSEIVLAPEVQNVLPPVRALPQKKPLMPLGHKSEIENYGMLRGGANGETTNGTPVVYYVDAVHQSASNATRTTLAVAPTPAIDTDILIDVELRAPSFVSGDFCGVSTPALPIPNDYAESVLLPIATFHIATQSTYFKRPEAMPAIQGEYDKALLRAGISDPTTTAPQANRRPSDR